MNPSLKTLGAVVIGTVLIGAGCSVVPERLPGNSLSNQARVLRQSAWVGIRGWEHAENPRSGSPKVIDTLVIEPPTEIRKERMTGEDLMNWAELWTVKRASSNVIYRIEFDLKGLEGNETRVIYAGGATNRPAGQLRR